MGQLNGADEQGTAAPVLASEEHVDEPHAVAARHQTRHAVCEAHRVPHERALRRAEERVARKRRSDQERVQTGQRQVAPRARFEDLRRDAQRRRRREPHHERLRDRRLRGLTVCPYLWIYIFVAFLI